MELFSEYAIIAGSTAFIYLFVIGAMRIFGKTEIAQLSVIDLVFIMLLGNAVQNAMVGSNTTLIGGFIAATTLYIMNWIFKLINFKYPHLFSSIEGGPTILIKDGRPCLDNLKRVHINNEEFLEALREHGVEHLVEVDLAILEEDGNISVLQKKDTFKQEQQYRKQTLPRRDTKKQ